MFSVFIYKFDYKFKIVLREYGVRERIEDLGVVWVLSCKVLSKKLFLRFYVLFIFSGL